MITISIPVGPYPFYKKYLPECIESVRQQTLAPSEILLIDDMADIDPKEYPDCTIWRSPWNLGAAMVANCGVSLAKNDLVFFMACDDKLKENAVQCLTNTWNRYKDPMAFYWVDIEYSTGETQALPTGHALVHKDLWKHTGGYPPQSNIGACDHILVNMLMIHGFKLIEVKGGVVYWHREHTEQYSKNQSVHYSSIEDTRDCFARIWKPTDNWGRYVP